MKEYLPSKKFFIVVLSLALLTGGIFEYQTWQKKAAADRQKQALAKINDYAVKNANVDTDGDGLMDWEEAIYHTDPKNRDTDGDGTSDGEEVAERRDPLVPGPNDYVRAMGDTGQSVTVSEKDLTETEKMMRTMLTAIIDSSNPTDPNYENQVTQGISNTISAKAKEIPVTYTLSQIKIITETNDTLKTYGNAIGKILKNQTDTEKENNNRARSARLRVFEKL